MKAMLLENYGGLDAGASPSAIHPSFSPDMRNMVEHESRRGLIRPRRGSKPSSLSKADYFVSQLPQWIGADGRFHTWMQYKDSGNTVDQLLLDETNCAVSGDILVATMHDEEFLTDPGSGVIFDILAARKYYTQWREERYDATSYANFTTDEAYTGFTSLPGMDVDRGYVSLPDANLSGENEFYAVTYGAGYSDNLQVAAQVTLGIAYTDALGNAIHVPIARTAAGGSGADIAAYYRWRMPRGVKQVYFYFQVSENQPNDAAWNAGVVIEPNIKIYRVFNGY